MSSRNFMIGALRRKFVLLIMLIAASVMAVAFSAICIIDYGQKEIGIYGILEREVQQAASTRGEPFQAGVNQPAPSTHDPKEAGVESDGPAPEIPAPKAPNIGGESDDMSQLPMAVYFVGDTGAIEAGSEASSADIDEAILQSAIKSVHDIFTEDGKRPCRGRLMAEGLYYAAAPTASGLVVAFADASSISWQPLAAILAIIGLIALAAFFLIAIAFSRWALRPVQEAWDRQQRFIADASHELKTPLTVILANLSILESHPGSTVEEQGQWIESTQTEARRMQSLVEDLLQMARFDRSVADSPETIDFSDMVEREMLAFEPVAFERDLAIEGSIEPGISLCADKDRTERLCAILLDNACKHGRAGSVIAISLSREGSRARLMVSNEGEAIAPEDLPRIFDRFYQADRARSTSAPKGFGLGLSIAREIVHGMRGEIAVKSREGEPTTFIVDIPLNTARRKG